MTLSTPTLFVLHVIQDAELVRRVLKIQEEQSDANQQESDWRGMAAGKFRKSFADCQYRFLLLRYNSTNPGKVQSIDKLCRIRRTKQLDKVYVTKGGEEVSPRRRYRNDVLNWTPEMVSMRMRFYLLCVSHVVLWLDFVFLVWCYFYVLSYMFVICFRTDSWSSLSPSTRRTTAGRLRRCSME